MREDVTDEQREDARAVIRALYLADFCLDVLHATAQDSDAIYMATLDASARLADIRQMIRHAVGRIDP